MSLTDSLRSIPSAVGQKISPWLTPLQKTDQQQEAARIVGQIGLGSLGFGGAAAALMMLRRKNERALLDEEKAKALLPVPIYTQEETERKQASIKGKSIAAGLGALGLGGTVAGLYYGNDGKDGVEAPNPVSRVFNTATGFMPGGQALREEQQRYLDLPGTIRGEHATSFANVPWFAPGAIGASILGLGAGYAGVNALGDFLAKRKLERKKRYAQKMFEAALQSEQRSKLGTALDEFISVCEASAPSIKEASMLEWYLALLGTAGVAGGMAGAYNGYHGATQSHRLAALKKIRQLQLAKRRSEELSLIPVPTPISQTADSTNESDEQKTADLVKTLAKPLWKGIKGAVKRTTQMVPATARTISKVPQYLMKEQPITTLTAGGLLGAEGLGRIADHYHSPLGQWKPSAWVFNRFADNQPLQDAKGNPIWGTRRLYSRDPNDFAEMKWSWNPLAERGFGWRFRKDQTPRRHVSVPEQNRSIPELVKQSNPSITMRRKMNEQFYDYEPR